ncbi:S-adenosyl-L-methionine-dependent methyltransferase [Pyronema omphalodes]|nr:S-adenosyl-L-methionine-dependent methyltransferase [Pyronema omphalodes]
MTSNNVVEDVLELLPEDDDDYQSTGYATTTESLTESIFEYIFENGRRYHSYFGVDKNLMPTDEKEQDRLDLHHEIMIQLLNGKYHLAPIDSNPQRILDIGTGTGIWAIDIAYQYPSAEVTGTDLSPIQPKWVPPNCKFEVDDAEQPWTFRPNTFDLIHSRNLNQAIASWPSVMSSMYTCCKPGGYVELAELECRAYSDDNTLAPDDKFGHFMNLLCEAMTKLGRPHASAEALVQRLEEAGFVDVQAVSVKQPFGPWPKDAHRKRIGALTMMMCESGCEAYGMAPFTRVLGMEKDEAAKVCREAVEAIRNRGTHVYSYYHVAYGRKPENSEL